VGIKTSHHGPWGGAVSRVTMEITKGSNDVNQSKSINSFLSSDYSLKLESTLKLKSLVIVYYHDTVNKYLGSVHTARHDLD
jgi:hypothetical protein